MLLKNSWLAIIIVLTLTVILTSEGMGQELKDNYALLIGVNEYNNVSHLQFCEADAELMKHALKRGGFPEDHIFLMTKAESRRSNRPDLEPTRSNIIRMIDSLVELCERGGTETMLFYFSGHGMHGQPPEDNNDYVLPSDAVLTNLKDTSLDVKSNIHDKLSTCGARNMVSIFDACRNIVKPGKTAVESSGFEAVAFTENQVVMNSCRPPSVSVEYPDIGDPSNSGSNGHGVYTYFLVKAILGEAPDKQQANMVKTKSAHAYLLSKVPDYVRQYQQQAPGFPTTQMPEISTVNDANVILAIYPPLQVIIENPKEKGDVQLSNEGGLYKFDVSGTSRGVYGGDYAIMAFLKPNKGPEGWYLHHHPTKISPVSVRPNGEWRCRYQVGNEQYPPIPGDPPIDIAVLVMTTDHAKETKEENPPGIPFDELPASLAEHIVWDVNMKFPPAK